MFRQMKRFPILNRIRFNSAQSTGSTEPTFGQLYFNYMKSNCLLFIIYIKIICRVVHRRSCIIRCIWSAQCTCSRQKYDSSIQSTFCWLWWHSVFLTQNYEKRKTKTRKNLSFQWSNENVSKSPIHFWLIRILDQKTCKNLIQNIV